MLLHIASILAFMIVSFAAQGLSHFVINKAHYATVGFARKNPIIPMGLLVMVIQGFMLSLALAAWRGGVATLIDGLLVSLVFGVFLVSYVAIVEPSKYTVPSIKKWLLIEGSVGLVQFVIYGLVLGLIHQHLG